MRSLRKIVQKSESTKEEGEEGAAEQSSPSRDQRSKEGEVIQNLATDSPRPEETSFGDKESEVKKEDSEKRVEAGSDHESERKKMEESLEKKRPVVMGSGIPARPPPPRLARKTSEDGVKPVRPPPPKHISTPSLTTSSKNEATPTSSVDKQPPKHRPVSPDHTPSSLPPSAGPSPVHSAGSATGSRSVSPQPPSSFYRARSEYVAQTVSELTLGVGDVLVELDRPTPDMFYGMLDDGSTGLFPASVVEPISAPSFTKK